jgi:hypothetical protein
MGKGTKEMAGNRVYVTENADFTFGDDQEAFPRETRGDLDGTEENIQDSNDFGGIRKCHKKPTKFNNFLMIRYRKIPEKGAYALKM